MRGGRPDGFQGLPPRWPWQFMPKNTLYGL
jgi:hypothetical protein